MARRSSSWTDFNAGDPGRTVVELLSFLGDSLSAAMATRRRRVLVGVAALAGFALALARRRDDD